MTPTATSHTEDSKRAELVLEQLAALPALAPVVIRLLDLTSRSDCDHRQVVQLLESDASFSAMLISQLMRSEHGVSRMNASVDRAVALLGIDAVRQLVLATGVVQVFQKGDDENRAFPHSEFWKHCLAVACLSAHLAPHMPEPQDRNEAFLAGLLHDLGKIALESCLPKSYQRVLGNVESTRRDLLVVEREIIGTDHTVAGRRLAQRWSLPQPLVDCIWLHHLAPEAMPGGISSPWLIKLIWLADALVRSHHLGFSGNDASHTGLTEAATRIGIEPRHCTEALAQLAAEVEQRAAWIGLEAGRDGAMYVQALTRSAQQLAALHDEVARQNRVFKRTADRFRALVRLHESLPPNADVPTTMKAAAMSARAALGLDHAAIYIRDEIGYGTLLARDGITLSAATIEPVGDSRTAPQNDELTTADLAASGSWLTAPPAGADDVLDVCRADSPSMSFWMMPLTCQRKWVGGLIFPAESGRLREIGSDATELAAISATLGLAIHSAMAHAHARRLGENLAWSQQKLMAAQERLAAGRSIQMTAEMAAGAAHELNTPLAIISGRAQLLSSRAEDDAQRAALNEIARNAHIASDIISELLAFAELAPPRPQTINLAELVSATVAAWPNDELRQRRIDLSGVPKTLAVRFDPEQLRGIMEELLRNAVQATTSENMRIVIKTAPAHTDDFRELEVIDNGCGMSQDVRSHAFDPFFSHRTAGRGRGMGLARAARWAESNGGQITLTSEPDKGTTVRIRMPAAPAATTGTSQT